MFVLLYFGVMKVAKAKKLPSGNYRVLEYSHTEIIDGKKVRKYESFTDSDKDEAEFQAAAFRRNKRKKQQPQNMTVREAIDQYIESGNAALSPTTIAGYKKIKRNHFASIMDMPLKNLSKEILQNCVNSEMKRPSKKYKNATATLSPKTIRNAYGLMTAVFNQYCKGLDYDVKLSAPVNKIKEVLPPEIIFDVIKGTKIELACVLAMWLSFSMSEVRGLTKSKSIRNGYLAVQEVVVDVEGKPTTKDQGKTFTRTRRHKIPPPFLCLL
jgi:hypothetical protein